MVYKQKKKINNLYKDIKKTISQCKNIHSNISVLIQNKYVLTKKIEDRVILYSLEKYNDYLKEKVDKLEDLVPCTINI